jgi:hypothetical protein
MDIVELNKDLRSQARNFGLCDQWYEEWSDLNCSQQELIDKYIKGLDFCILHHYPSNDFIKSNFDRDLLHKNNIVVDERHSLLNPMTAVILGNSKSKVRVNGYSVCRVYVRDNSSVDVFIRHKAHLIIHVYDHASVTIVENTTVNIPKIILHGENAHYKMTGLSTIDVVRK